MSICFPISGGTFLVFKVLQIDPHDKAYDNRPNDDPQCAFLYHKIGFK